MNEHAPDSRHVGSGQPSTPVVPEPPFAERARTLVHVGRTGTLSTLSRKAPGFPFGSVAPYGLAGGGQPTFLISTLAMHTQNLLADAHASLLVTQPGWTEDPLAGARVTLLGPVTPIPATAIETARADYLARHETARYWVDFGDFQFYRMEVQDLYFVAGFGAMGWVAAHDFAAAQPDPLADTATSIIAHMNADHRDALKLYCEHFAATPADDAEMTAVDRLGFRVRARCGEQLRGVRIPFPEEVRCAGQARVVLVQMVRDARARASPRT